MFDRLNPFLACVIPLMLGFSTLVQADDKPWKDIGRKATPAEVKAWDIDVRGDFKGLPKGKGTVAQGEIIWEAKCTSCHGTFGELNEVFTPIVGGTTEEDIKKGVVAANKTGGVAQRTTMMKVARLSTLWDYINRAMPWNAPKSLSPDEVYSVVAYILNLSAIVPADFTLSNENIAQVQQRLPNRNGVYDFPGLWHNNGKPDVKNVACMKNCPVEDISSRLPEYARNAHGNLAEQNRVVGPVRGADTTRPEPTALSPAATKPAAVTSKASNSGVVDVKAILNKNACTACHGLKNKVVGPGFNEIAAKYKDKPDLESYLKAKIKSGGSGVWGSIPMPPQTTISDGDLKAIAAWLAAGA